MQIYFLTFFLIFSLFCLLFFGFFLLIADSLLLLACYVLAAELHLIAGYNLSVNPSSFVDMSVQPSVIMEWETLAVVPDYQLLLRVLREFI